MVPVLAGFAVILASMVNFLQFNRYPVLSVEVAIVLCGILALALVVGFVHHRQRALGQAILESLLIFFVVDQNGGSAAAALAALVVGAIVLAARRSLLPFLGVAAGITLFVGIIGIGTAPNAHPTRAQSLPPQFDARRLPAIVHIVLDEHIAPGGLPDDNPGSAIMADQLRRFYLTRGFRLYDRAYSEHMHTVNSIPSILNFGTIQAAGSDPSEGTTLRRSAYFDRLRARGYQISIRQSDFIDYCAAGPARRCATYDSASLAVVATSTLSLGERARLIAARFLLLSPTAETMGQIYLALAGKLMRAGLPVHMPDLGLPLAGRVSSLSALNAFDEMIGDLRRLTRGEVYFAHMLLPHYPHATNPDCSIKPLDDWMIRRSREPRRKREQGYFDQMRCAMKKLDEAFEALDASPAGRDAIVIVHGDHGSRLTVIDPMVETMGKFEDRDVIAGFATLFAIRAPGVEPALVERPASVSSMLADFMRRDFRSAPEPQQKPSTIILHDLLGTPRRSHPFPDAGSSGYQ